MCAITVVKRFKPKKKNMKHSRSCWQNNNNYYWWRWYFYWSYVSRIQASCWAQLFVPLVGHTAGSVMKLPSTFSEWSVNFYWKKLSFFWKTRMQWFSISWSWQKRDIICIEILWISVFLGITEPKLFLQWGKLDVKYSNFWVLSQVLYQFCIQCFIWL